MELILKSKEKEKAKKFFPKFQSILMQVAKTGIINEKLQQEKFRKFQKNYNFNLIINSKLIKIFTNYI